MATFIYVDETGSVGKGANRQRYLTLASVLVPEEKVKLLGQAMRDMAFHRLGWRPADFEYHGYEIWNRMRWWNGKDYGELIAAYHEVIDLLNVLDLYVAHSSIDKHLLHSKYSGSRDDNAYRLALQFLLEKIDPLAASYKVVIADEHKEQELKAIKMVSELQEWGVGEVPGRQLATIIDSLHFVQSNASPGVQMADLVAYILQRSQESTESHPDAIAALSGLRAVVDARTVTRREPWPRQQ